MADGIDDVAFVLELLGARFSQLPWAKVCKDDEVPARLRGEFDQEPHGDTHSDAGDSGGAAERKILRSVRLLRLLHTLQPPVAMNPDLRDAKVIPVDLSDMSEFIKAVQNHFVFKTCLSRCKIRRSEKGLALTR